MVWSFPDRCPAGRSSRPSHRSRAADTLDAAGLPAVEGADGISIYRWINDPSRDPSAGKPYWRMAGGKLARNRRAEIELYPLAGDVKAATLLANNRRS